VLGFGAGGAELTTVVKGILMTARGRCDRQSHRGRIHGVRRSSAGAETGVRTHLRPLFSALAGALFAAAIGASAAPGQALSQTLAGYAPAWSADARYDRHSANIVISEFIKPALLAHAEDLTQSPIPFVHGRALRFFLPIPQVNRRHAEQSGRRVVKHCGDGVRQHSGGLHSGGDGTAKIVQPPVQ
jgi:hypothetical protein